MIEYDAHTHTHIYIYIYRHIYPHVYVNWGYSTSSLVKVSGSSDHGTSQRWPCHRFVWLQDHELNLESVQSENLDIDHSRFGSLFTSVALTGFRDDSIFFKIFHRISLHFWIVIIEKIGIWTMNLTTNFCHDGKLSISLSISSEASNIGILKPPSDWPTINLSWWVWSPCPLRRKFLLVGWIRKNVVVPVILPDILVVLCYTLQY